MAQQDIYYTGSPGWTWNLMQSPNLRAPDGMYTETVRVNKNSEGINLELVRYPYED